jgi:HSP20 family protein
MAESVSRYFRVMAVRGRCRPAHGAQWRPAADVYKTPEGFVIKLDLAGVSPDEVEVEAEGSSLRIAGVRRDALYAEGYSYHQLEITYSHFERTFDFPCAIDETRVERDYCDGLLILTVYRRTKDE